MSGSPDGTDSEEVRRRIVDEMADQGSGPLPKTEEMLESLYGDGTTGGFIHEGDEQRAGVIPGRSFEFVSPVFMMDASHPALMRGVRPATADAQLDLADLPVVALNQVISVGMPGASYEFGLPFYLRYERPRRVYRMTYWDAGDETYRHDTLDPWEREAGALIDIDEACDELGELDRTNPAAPPRALALTFAVLRGWFEPGPIKVQTVVDWDSKFVVTEVRERGAWLDGSPPWTLDP